MLAYALAWQWTALFMVAVLFPWVRFSLMPPFLLVDLLVFGVFANTLRRGRHLDSFGLEYVKQVFGISTERAVDVEMEDGENTLALQSASGTRAARRRPASRAESSTPESGEETVRAESNAPPDSGEETARDADASTMQPTTGCCSGLFLPLLVCFLVAVNCGRLLGIDTGTALADVMSESRRVLAGRVYDHVCASTDPATLADATAVKWDAPSTRINRSSFGDFVHRRVAKGGILDASSTGVYFHCLRVTPVQTEISHEGEMTREGRICIHSNHPHLQVLCKALGACQR